jgi:hypothetical protein
VRSNCAAANTQLACIDKFPGGTDESIVIPNVAGNANLTIFVDGFSLGNEGAYTITAVFTVPEAGRCADNVDNDGDGQTDCADSECTGDPACFDPCFGAPAINLGVTMDTTVGGTNTYDVDSGLCFQLGGAPERIYVFTPATSGDLHAVVTTTGGVDLGSIIQECGIGGAGLACTDDIVNGNEEAVAAVTAGTPVAVIVDGFASSSMGPFTLTLSIP